MHILLDIRIDDCQEIEYARILGFRKGQTDVLSLMKLRSEIPLVAKLANADKLTPSGRIMLNQDVYVSNLYESVIADKYKTPFINEYQQQIVIV